MKILKFIFAALAAFPAFAQDDEKIVAKAVYEKFKFVRVSVDAPRSFAGKVARAEDGDGHSVSATLVEKDKRARTILDLPDIPAGKTAGAVSVFVDSKAVPAEAPGDLNKLRREALLDSEFYFEKYVFDGDAFPAGHFGQRGIIENLHIPFTIETQFYDAKYQRLPMPTGAGRYGAITTVSFENGRTMTRFATLFRKPVGALWNASDLPGAGATKMAELFPSKLPSQDRVVDPFLVKMFKEWGECPDTLASAASALFEGTDVSARGSFGVMFAQNQKWWFGLMQKTGLAKLNYAFALPEGFDAASKTRWPLLLFLHGSGECGTDLGRVRWHGPLHVIDGGRKLPFIVIAPQCPSRGWWNPWQLNALLDEVCAKYPADADRIYLTGLSMGGFGAWHFAAEFPERFAAVAVMCGKGGTADADRLKDLPVWIFHGKLDGGVPPKFSDEMMSALIAVKGRVKRTLYSNVGHDCWKPAYNDPALYEWMLKQKRGAPEQWRAESVEAATTVVEGK